MFDIGWSEMAVVALLALLVIGPKDLPRVMRTAAHWMRKARSVTREFQSGLDDMIREAELEDAKKSIQAASRGDFKKTIADTIDPTGSVTEAINEVERDARNPGEATTPTPSLDSSDKVADTSDGKREANIAPPHSVVPPEDPFKASEENAASHTAPVAESAPADDVATGDAAANADGEAAPETLKESAKA